MPKYFVLPHLGLGDQLIMNGFVNFLCEQLQAEQVMILIKTPHKRTLQDLYSGNPKVSFLGVDGDQDIWGPNPQPFRDAVKAVTEQGFLSIPCGVFSGQNDYLKLDPCWANCFYAQHKLPPQIRWDFFRLPPSLPNSQTLYKKLTQRIGKDYIVIHDDPSRKLNIPHDTFMNWLMENNLLDHPCIYLGEDRYKQSLFSGVQNPNVKDLLKVESILDYTEILQNAKACHMIDSSLAILLDLSYNKQKNPGQKRVSYIRYSAFPTKGLYKNEWEYVE